MPTKIAIFIGDGIGDALFTIPLINFALQQKYDITVIFTSKQPNYKIFDCIDLPVKQIVLHKSTHARLQLLKKHFNYFDIGILSVSSESVKNIFISMSIAKKIYSFRTFPLQGMVNFRYQTRHHTKGHVIQNNLKLLSEDAARNWQTYMFVKALPIDIRNFSLPKSYVVIQPSSANNIYAHKNWTADGWAELFSQLKKSFANTTFVFIGEANEQQYIQAITSAKNCINLMGKTNIQIAAQVVAGATAYIGLDTGFLHWAVLCNIPTFSLWGGTNPLEYGYKTLNSSKHYIIKQQYSCSPCESMIAPNRTRVPHHTQCPDFACMRTLQPSFVLLRVSEFLQTHLNYNINDKAEC
ncbi:MAG: glycosyltransferase family 9 protein [Saprospiraceae bacterium]|nr:glycosyltransferase family 9 protein [Saprospiraceae bacterium]MBP7699439.1 glycosyltransferase family 9 protein [Saprospiraceae bacterium]